MRQVSTYANGLILLACLVLQPACRGPVASPVPAGKAEYATGFRIEEAGAFRILHVINPWQGSRTVRFQYVLTDDPSQVPDSLKHLPVITIPVTRVVCMSTTHVAMMDALGVSAAIVGVSGSDYISSPGLRQRLDNGNVKDVGADQTLNYELILSLRPDLVMAYGIGSEVGGMVKRLEATGIPVVLNGDYLENHPLGKTEWIKFVASFFERDREADSIFGSVASAYRGYRDLVLDIGEKPTVMTGLPWKDVWYIPGGRSFAAAFIRDAGGVYLWEDLDSREALPIDLEAIYSRAAGADIWINCGSAGSIAEIGRTDPRLLEFNPIGTGRVFNNNARTSPAGGNDFWESGVMAPHLILTDMISIFHPSVLPDHELVYYVRLE